nr:hypothetical protein [Desulfobulbaceae bacterium]
MKILIGCFSTARTALTCIQALSMGIFLATILTIDMASRLPGFMFTRLTR